LTDNTHEPCPYVECGSSDAFNWEDEKHIGYCHACHRSYPSKARVFDWADEAYPRNQMIDLKKWRPTLDNPKITFGIRGIDPDVCKLYKIQRQTDDQGNWLQDAFGYPSNVKYRSPTPEGEKKTCVWKNPGQGATELFGPNFTPGASKRLYITEGECFLPDSEVLTPQGWKSFENLSTLDRVMQVSCIGHASFVEPVAIIDKHYDGDLIEYKSGSFYSLTTEGHELVRVSPDGEYKKYPATTHKHLKIPRVPNTLAPIESPLSVDQYRVWIMLSADFTFRPSGDIYAAFKKDRKIKRVHELLGRLGVRYSSNKETRGYTNFFIHRGHNLEWAKKELPWEIVYSKHRMELLQEVMQWDGNQVPNRNQGEFSTNLKHNADVVQALAHCCGWTSTIIDRKNSYGEWYKVSILYTKRTSSTQKGFQRVPYKGRVMCVQVPDGRILVRQKGSVSVSGNCDAASLYQILGKTWPVKSIPSSSIGPKFFQANREEFEAYETIVYAGELDDSGRQAADKFYAAYPHKMHYVPLTKFKDANAYLNHGTEKDHNELKWAALKPQKYSPPNFHTGDDDWLKALREEDPYQTYRIGHSQFDAKTRGLVKGGLTLIKAPRGSGKTSFFRYMQYKMRKEHPDVPFALMHTEESLSTTVRNMVTYELGTNVNTKEDQKDNGITDEELEAAAIEIKGDGKIIPFELLPTDTPLSLVDYTRLAATVFGAEFVFVDHLQRLVYRSGLDRATEDLTQVATQLAELGKELNIGIIAISHINTNGVTQYASSLENEAIIVIDVERDIDNEDEILQNTSEFIVTKNRPFAKLGSAGKVYYNPDTTRLEETV